MRGHSQDGCHNLPFVPVDYCGDVQVQIFSKFNIIKYATKSYFCATVFGPFAALCCPDSTLHYY